jgi:exopolysaccharide biosynthesis predicted pyruvyltransferase EpsI
MLDTAGKDFGNNGDELIQLGGELLLSAANIQHADSPESADLLIMRGNGAMIRGYTLARKILADTWSRYPDKPLLMMPATFHYPHEQFTTGLPSRSAPVTLFCREQYSHRHLLEDHDLPTFCSVDIGRDTAFDLEQDSLVTSRRNAEPQHVLICERNDAEHPMNQSSFWSQESNRPARSLLSKLARTLPPALKKPLYPIKAAIRSRKRTPFRQYCEQLLNTDPLEKYSHLPRVYRDVSDRSLGDFDQFCDTIANSAIVFSTRLHVGIYAAMLGRPTYIFEGPYHKIRAIYEHSMSEMPHVTFVSRQELKTAVS